MNLYVFKAVGSYFGGAVGVVAESPSEALAFAEERRQEYLRMEEAGETWEAMQKDLREEPCCLRPEDVPWKRPFGEKSAPRPVDHFVLSEVFRLHPGNLHDKGVVFCWAHEG